MSRTPSAIDMIKVELLLQAAAGNECVPGLHAALEKSTPMPGALPKRDLSREEFLADYVMPWLAGRLRGGETLDDIMDDYQLCAAPWRDAMPMFKSVLIG